MSVLVGSARIDENGKISGGQPGDQTGNEVCTQEWYSKPWDFMAIHPDANVRELHAQAVEQACANDNVGYNQNRRNTLNTQAALVDYVIKNIKTKCECDCSSLQNVAAIASGAEKASNYGSNGWTTSTMRSALKALGYIIITASTYLTSAAYCVRGAIYVSEGHHTVGGLTNGSKYKETLEKAGVSTSGSTSSGTTGSTGSTGSSGGTTSSDDDNYTYTDELKVDGEIGPNTVKRLQTVMGQKGKKNVDGFIDGQQAASKQYWTSITSKACSWTGGSSPVVKKIQQFVINKGFSCGSAGADGKLGKNTAIGIQKFLISLGFSCGSAGADGKFGENSAMALQKWLNTK